MCMLYRLRVQAESDKALVVSIGQESEMILTLLAVANARRSVCQNIPAVHLSLGHKNRKIKLSEWPRIQVTNLFETRRIVDLNCVFKTRVFELPAL